MKIGLWLICVLIASVLIFDQYRRVWCLSSGKCITVWKRIGGDCYIMPYKYYLLSKPFDNYIRTSNTGLISVVWEDDRIVYVDGSDEFEIINQNSRAICILSYEENKSRNDSVFTDIIDGYRQYKEDVIYFSIDIEENWARYKNNN